MKYLDFFCGVSFGLVAIGGCTVTRAVPEDFSVVEAGILEIQELIVNDRDDNYL